MQKPEKIPKWARTKAELAEMLAVSRKTVQRASALPGWPKPMDDGRMAVEKCREFIKEHFDVLEESGAAVPDGFASWREFGDAQKAQREAIKLAKDKSEVADKPFVKLVVARGMNALHAELKRVLCSELPAQCQGADAITIATKNGAALESAFENFRTIAAQLESQP